MTESEHLLIVLGEECAEVAQRVTKALRFGLDERQPGQPLTNAERLADEIGDVFGIIDMLSARGLLSDDDVKQRIHDARCAKPARVLRYMEYAREIGRLE